MTIDGIGIVLKKAPELADRWVYVAGQSVQPRQVVGVVLDVGEQRLGEAGAHRSGECRGWRGHGGWHGRRIGPINVDNPIEVFAAHPVDAVAHFAAAAR